MPEVHHRLLQAGEAGQAQQLAEGGFVPNPVLPPHPQGGEGLPSVPRQPQAGQILGDHRGQGCPLHSHLEGHHKEEVQADVQHHRDPQEEQGGDGVAHRPEEVGKKVIEKGGHNPGKDPQQVGLGEVCDLRGNLQQEEDGGHQGVDQGVEHQGDGANEEKSLEDAAAQLVRVLPAKLDGEVDAAAHAQPQKDGGEKGHQGVGGPHRSQGPLPDELPHYPGVGQIIQLLQEVAQDQGEGKPQQAPGNAPLGSGRVWCAWRAPFWGKRSRLSV